MYLRVALPEVGSRCLLQVAALNATSRRHDKEKVTTMIGEIHEKLEQRLEKDDS